MSTRKTTVATFVLISGMILSAAIFLYPITAVEAQVSCPAGHVEFPAGSGKCLDSRGCPSGFARPEGITQENDPEGTQCSVDYRTGTGGQIGTNTNYVPNADPYTGPPAFTCEWWSWSLMGCLGDFTFLIMNLFGALMLIAGLLLNGMVQLTIGNMADFVKAIGGVQAGWEILRNLSNTIILFLVLFSAIGMILRTDKIVSKGTLAKILIAALLINFSMFFTKVIIDVSNVLTFEIHQSLEKFEGKIVLPSGDQRAIPPGLAGIFLAKLNPVTTYNGALEQKNAEAQGIPDVESHLVQQMIFGIVIILIVTFVFFVVAIMLFVRFILFIFLIITSPIGFVGGLIPKLKPYATQWWGTLLGQAFFAPVFMLCMLITVTIISDPRFTAGLASSGICDATWCTSGVFALFDFTGGFIGLVQYGIIIFFLIMSLSVAKSIAGKTGSGVVSSASKWAGKAAFGGLAWAGANTVGRLGKGLADSQFANKLQSSNSAFARLAGQGLIGAGKGLGNASFDIRGADWAKELGAGKAAPGFIKREKEEQKRIEDATKNLRAKEDMDEKTRDLLEVDIKKNEEVIKTLEEQRKVLEKEMPDENTAGTERERAEKQAKIKALDEELAKNKSKLEEDKQRFDNSPAIQARLAKEARIQVAELSRKLTSAEMRRVQAAANEKDEGKQRALLMGISEHGPKLVKALQNMAAANEKLGNIQKGTTMEWANRNAAAGGPVGAVVEKIRKEAGKSKGQRIFEAALQDAAKKDEGGGDSGDGGKKPEGGAEPKS